MGIESIRVVSQSILEEIKKAKETGKIDILQKYICQWCENSNYYPKEAQINIENKIEEIKNKKISLKKEGKEKPSIGLSAEENPEVKKAEKNLEDVKKTSEENNNSAEKNVNNTKETAEKNKKAAEEQTTGAKEQAEKASENVNTAEISVSDAEENLANAESNANTNNETGSSNSNEIKTEVENTKKQVEQAKKNLEEAKQAEDNAEKELQTAETKEEEIKTEGEESIKASEKEADEIKTDGEKNINEAELNLEKAQKEAQEINNILKEAYNNPNSLEGEKQVREILDKITPENINYILSKDVSVDAIAWVAEKEDIDKLVDTFGKSIDNIEQTKNKYAPNGEYTGITDLELNNNIDQTRAMYNDILSELKSEDFDYSDTDILDRLNALTYYNKESIGKAQWMNECTDINGKLDLVANQRIGNCWAHGGFESIETTAKGVEIIKNNISRDSLTGITTVTLPEAGKSYQISDQELYDAVFSKGDPDMTAYVTAIDKYFKETNERGGQTNGNTTTRVFEIMTGTKTYDINGLGKPFDEKYSIPNGVSSISIAFIENSQKKDVIEKVYNQLLSGDIACNIGVYNHAWSVAGVKDGNILIRESNQSGDFMESVTGEDQMNMRDFNRGSLEYISEMPKEKFIEFCTSAISFGFFK